MTERENLLKRIRFLLGFFIVALVASGVTAFPLLRELDLLASLPGVGDASSPDGHAGLALWILRVREGLRVTYSHYPFIAYGTDWLAFAHIVIALFFIAPFVDPVRNVAAIRAGLAACVLVLPLALICGAVRGIPFYWRLIDCSFGVLGFVPLWHCLKLVRRLEKS